jgi:hypothetical protein
MNNRGQAGPLGEDILALVVIVLALAAYVTALNSTYAGRIIQRTQADKSLLNMQTAAYLATQWGYQSEQNTSYSRLIDPAKACIICPSGVFAELKDIETNQTLCSCGNRTDGTVTKLPVAIRYNITAVSAGTLETRFA